MIVVSNTSPISNLAALGNLPLLQQVYHNIIIPSAVADEIAPTRGGGQRMLRFCCTGEGVELKLTRMPASINEQL
ncbi:MAG: hypothetical protein RLO37_05480 [Coleofasciculus chthonoplastes F1-TOW-03]